MLEGIVLTLRQLDQNLNDAAELLEMAQAENDDASLRSIADDLQQMEGQVADMEFRRMFSGELDANN